MFKGHMYTKQTRRICLYNNSREASYATNSEIFPVFRFPFAGILCISSTNDADDDDDGNSDESLVNTYKHCLHNIHYTQTHAYFHQLQNIVYKRRRV